jgi:hypothetical protein
LSKILKNQTVLDINLDIGITIPASGSFTLSPQDYDEAAASEDIIVKISSGDIIVNDSSKDLTITEGTAYIQGNFPTIIGIKSSDGTQIGGVGDRLKVDTTVTNGNISFGNIDISDTSIHAVRKTVYSEQNTDSTRSISSSSVADSPAVGVVVNTLITANDLGIIYPEIKALVATSTHAAAFGSGEILSPNIYDINSAGSIAGTLNLNGGGDSNALFVFKFNGAFTIGASATIVLSNGASANNVLFISEAAISIAASCDVSGIFIAKIGAVTVGAGCDITGRIATLCGNITTDQDNINSPVSSSVIDLRSLSTFSIFTSSGNVTNTLGAISSLISGNIGTDAGAIVGYGSGNSTVSGGIYIQNNLTSVGTGALSVLITYFTSTGLGPYSETLTLDGIDSVNTISSDICYIERMEVITAGPSGSNAGTITLHSAVDKGGTAIGTIAPNDNKTFWGHHYVATGKTCYISGISGSSSRTNNSSSLLFIRQRPIGVTSSTDMQLNGDLKIYNKDSSIVRNYNSQISVTGPTRLIIYVKSESSSSQTINAEFDFTET